MRPDKQHKYDKNYLARAEVMADSLSYGQRLKVGCLIVKDGVIAEGFNGTPSGMDNVCEDDDGNTHWFVIHAEMNAMLKCARSGRSCEGATMYLTHSPCRECSKSIVQARIQRVVYLHEYRDTSGITFLRERGVRVEHHKEKEDEKTEELD